MPRAHGVESRRAEANYFADAGRLHPDRAPPAAPRRSHPAVRDVWEWTASSYTAYPGFRPLARRALGEYNGKFMSGQYVLRGGIVLHAGGSHPRCRIANFFRPQARLAD